MDDAGLRMTTRTCAGCDLCCTAVGVEELAKPAGVRCKHLTALAPAGRNCTIYARRPGSCSGFICFWRMSDTALSDEYHPPNCGFVVSAGDPFATPIVVTVHPDPKRPTAWDRPHFRARFARLARDLNCLVAVGQGDLATHVFSPAGRVYTKAKHPRYFVNGGESVGAPASDFRPTFPTVEEVARVLWPVAP